jgi:hypothetical protein
MIFLWHYRKEGEAIKCRFSGEEETTSDVHAVMYLTQHFILSLNGKYCAERYNPVFILSFAQGEFCDAHLILTSFSLSSLFCNTTDLELQKRMPSEWVKISLIL